jgi:hypothetical protein
MLSLFLAFHKKQKRNSHDISGDAIAWGIHNLGQRNGQTAEKFLEIVIQITAEKLIKNNFEKRSIDLQILNNENRLNYSLVLVNQKFFNSTYSKCER